MRYTLSLVSGDSSKSIGITRLIDAEIPHVSYHHNRVYVCPQCGVLWAKWEKEQAPGEWPQQYFAYNRSCPNHQLPAWTGDRPGSIVSDSTDIVVLSRAALERELLLLTAKGDNEQHSPS